VGFFSFFYPWGVLLQVAALLHFLRRRPDGIWLWIIIFLGPLGATAYILLEMVPDLGLLRNVYDAHGRRRRIARLEALVKDNPSAGNYEELGDLLLEEGKFAQARECYDKVIPRSSEHLDALYRRGIAEIHLNDFAAAAADLEAVTAREPKYDLHRALGLLAHAYANTGQPDLAERLFSQATSASTSSETYFNYATFLAAQGRKDEARDFAERILAKKPNMPRYLQRRERPWFRKAKGLLSQLRRGRV
jgi:hypothetical protein